MGPRHGWRAVKPPAHIAADPEAAKLYRRFAKVLAAAGRLDDGAALVLGQYVHTELMLRKINAQLATEPCLVKGGQGAFKVNPLITALNTTAATNLKLATALGFVGGDAKPRNARAAAFDEAGA